MNTQTILNAITVEKDKFLAKYEDKAYFKKKASVFFTDFMGRGDKLGPLGTSLTCIAFLFTFFGSIGLSAYITKQMESLFHINDFLGAIFCILLVIPLSLAALKISVSSVLKCKYKRRQKNNLIAQLFTDDFYDSEVSPEIKNMLKLLLSEDQYFKLREGKAQITYKDAQAALNSIIERENVMEEKHEVFLSPEEIKKYSYVNAG